MIIINKNIDINIKSLKERFDSLENLLIFDIETTGFSYRKNIIYLIGCVYFVDEQANIIQWLAENENDEYAVIYEFIKFSNDFKCIVHYNGTTFDIPFVSKKAHLYRISNTLSCLDNIDIYKLIKPCKHIFNIENCKLKTIEKYLNIHRKDKFSGGELINQFISYTNSKDIIIRNNLLQHNEDDIIGLTKSLKILDYIDIYNNLVNNKIPFTIDSISIEEMILAINISLSTTTPFDYKYTHGNYSVHINNERIVINISLIKDELKYFFDNYKDYYYVYSEDQAIHKDIAKYIDKDNKIKATRELSYIKKRGIFIPLLDNYNAINENLFYTSTKSKTRYIMLLDCTLENNTFIENLCISVLNNL
ncbi:hypothetical protein SH1V18_26170 [Vallitalea longa]|uniref:YprB ribonuclease H-like domain-containing protein n=1 Tax=Vallitalea longa TaxID=2936439 RepID=A0A9W6DG37_9FIRM|nr:ribonuclease H-like domain-containing protein [Vallitalea longa]GKX30137.1 hypothetical protein SH1V18_26170 [Vallitalea longa]